MCNSKCYDTISIIVSLVLGVIFAILVFCFPSVSYTHLDVYKRQHEALYRSASNPPKRPRRPAALPAQQRALFSP